MKPVYEQTVLITGATDGLGRAVAHALAAEGATVLLHGRSKERLDGTMASIRSESEDARLKPYLADLSSLDEVRTLARQLLAENDRLDVLISNAAVGPGRLPRNQRELSKDGLELRFAVNYLADYVLSNLLLPLLRRAVPSRIVHVSSAGQQAIDFDDVMLERSYDGMEAYRKSKLAQILHTIDQAEALAADGITVNALHPAALMPTTMVFEAYPNTASTLDDGVQSVVNLAISPDVAGVTGKYFSKQREATANAQAYNDEARRRLREIAERLTGIRAG